MSIVALPAQPLSGESNQANQTSILDRLRNFSLTVRTTLDAKTFFTSVLPPSIRNKVAFIHDESYPHKPKGEERRHFVVCPDEKTYNLIRNDLLSQNISFKPHIKVSYWEPLAMRIDKGEVYKEDPSISSLPRDVELVGPRPERTAIYAAAQMDVVTTIISMFPQRPLIAWTNANNALGLAGVPVPHHHHLGPTGQETCLPKILAHSRRWTPQTAHLARRMASQEVKSLARSFRQKYQDLIHACTNNARINLTFDGAMAIVNAIQDRRQRRKWMVAQIREMDKFNKDVDVMLSEYFAIMSHFQSLQRACIAAANEAYNIDIIIIPTNFLPTATSHHERSTF